MKSRWILPAVALPLAWVTPAWADAIYGFGGVSNNNSTNIQTGGAQLKVTVAAEGSGQVSFAFTNSGPLASSITDVYFDDGTLLGIASVVDGTGVDFEQSATPPELPSANQVNFNTTANFSADSEEPIQPNGVNPGETVTIIFNLINGKTYADTINAIELALANPGVDMDGGLRIGIHVQGFSGGGSESFVNAYAPLPPVILGGAMLMGLVGLRRARLEA
jgi:hypothetical protein